MSDWSELSAERDHETLALLHLAAQMIGKIRVAHAPWLNYGWHVALQPNARGLGIYPTAASGGRTFTLTLDLCRHAIVLWISDGGREEVPLNAGSIAALHRRLVAILEQHELPSTFNDRPSELPDAPPFAEDNVRRDYDRDLAERFRAALAAMLPVFARFRAGFSGKASPVHFWWGSFDLAVSRFSGRKAPKHPGGVPGLPDRVHARGLQRRGQQCRLLGGRSHGGRALLLQLRLSRGRWLSRLESCSRQVRRGLWRVHPSLCCRASFRRSGTNADGVLPIRLRCSGRSRALGSSSARAGNLSRPSFVAR